jgi:hypothetical protein
LQLRAELRSHPLIQLPEGALNAPQHCAACWGLPATTVLPAGDCLPPLCCLLGTACQRMPAPAKRCRTLDAPAALQAAPQCSGPAACHQHLQPHQLILWHCTAEMHTNLCAHALGCTPRHHIFTLTPCNLCSMGYGCMDAPFNNTKCVTGTTCAKVNAFYWQCNPPKGVSAAAGAVADDTTYKLPAITSNATSLNKRNAAGSAAQGCSLAAALLSASFAWVAALLLL